jgi:hypothetical protein
MIMDENIDFEEIGKRNIYEVPEGFFEKISETTLQKAKEREKKHRRTVVLRRIVIITVSMAAMILIGIFLPVFNRKADTKMVAYEVKPVMKTAPQTKILPAPVTEKKEIRDVEDQVAVVENTEKVSDVLADLTDEELSQLSGQLETDQFMDEF